MLLLRLKVSRETAIANRVEHLTDACADIRLIAGRSMPIMRHAHLTGR